MGGLIAWGLRFSSGTSLWCDSEGPGSSSDYRWCEYTSTNEVKHHTYPSKIVVMHSWTRSSYLRDIWPRCLYMNRKWNGNMLSINLRLLRVSMIFSFSLFAMQMGLCNVCLEALVGFAQCFMSLKSFEGHKGLLAADTWMLTVHMDSQWDGTGGMVAHWLQQGGGSILHCLSFLLWSLKARWR